MEMLNVETVGESPTFTFTQSNSLIDQLNTWDDDDSDFEDTCERIQRSLRYRSMKNEKARRKKVSESAISSCRGIQHRHWLDNDENQVYGQIVKALGACTFEVKCFDGMRYIGKLRGLMRRKVWVDRGDVVLVSLREFDSHRVDIIRTHSMDEAQYLKYSGEIPRSVKLGYEFFNSLFLEPHEQEQEEEEDSIFETDDDHYFRSN